MTIAGEVLMLIGSVTVLLAGIGVLRFGGVYARMHAATKAPTLGLALIATGLGLVEQSTAATVTLILIVFLYLLTIPVGIHVLGGAVHQANPPDVDVVDELLRDEAIPRGVPAGDEHGGDGGDGGDAGEDDDGTASASR